MASILETCSVHNPHVDRPPGAIVDGRAPRASVRCSSARVFRHRLPDGVPLMRRAALPRSGGPVGRPRLAYLLQHACGRRTRRGLINIDITIIVATTAIAVVTTAAGHLPATSIAMDTVDAPALSSPPASLLPPPTTGTWTAADAPRGPSW